MGVPSQCVLAKNVKNNQRADNIISNIVLQITAKQGKSLWNVKDISSVIDNDVMVCGVN